MNKVILIFICALYSPLTLAFAYIEEQQELGYQVDASPIYYTGYLIKAKQTFRFLGLTAAAGWEAECQNSLVVTGGASYSGFPQTTVWVGTTKRMYPTGWDSWANGSVHFCNTRWKQGVSSGIISVGGIGVNWSMSWGETRSSTFQGYMIKPEVCEDIGGGEVEGDCATPLVIDIDGDGFNFSSLSEGVLFDIDADSVLEKTTWTQAGDDDAFLFFDIDKNYRVDGGYELFGDHVSLLSGKQMANGFAALAEIDQLSFDGNNDGVVDKGDYHFRNLALWNDYNHNGISEENEVISLKEAGVEALGLELNLVDWEDDNGNWISLASWAAGKATGKNRSSFIWVTADVNFRVE